MEKNAFVVWDGHPEPWTIERDLLHEISCPLNIKDNEQTAVRPRRDHSHNGAKPTTNVANLALPVAR